MKPSIAHAFTKTCVAILALYQIPLCIYISYLPCTLKMAMVSWWYDLFMMGTAYDKKLHVPIYNCNPCMHSAGIILMSSKIYTG